MRHNSSGQSLPVRHLSRGKPAEMCVTMYIDTTATNLSLKLGFWRIFFEPLHPLRRNVAILRRYRLRSGVLAAVVWVSCSKRFASGLREVQSAGGKLTRQKF
jgi:hypothetical protein